MMEPKENHQSGAVLAKLDLNNQIVRMRHNVNRAKVQTLNKLNHRIKKLRSKNETYNVNGKNEAKAERLLQEFFIIKKIPPDEVAAFSLSNTKKVDDIFKDVSSSWRLKALARLSTHKSLVPVVKMFRSKYPSWEKELPKVLIALKKRKKLKPDDNLLPKNKKDKTLSINNNSGEESNKAHSLQFDIDSSKFSDVPDSVDESSNYSDADYEVLDSGNKVSQSNDNLLDSGVQKSRKNASYVITKGNRFSVSSDDFNLSDVCQKKIYEKIHLNKQQNSLKHSEVQSSNESLKKREDSPVLACGKTNVDPFFMGSNNEVYKTENPVVEMTFKDEEILHRKPHLEDENLDYKWKPNKFSWNKLQLTNNNFGKSPKNSLSFKCKDSFRRGSFDNRQFSDRVTKCLQFNDKVNKSSGKSKQSWELESRVTLHPSWEAKKKQNSAVQFSGKKIVFD